MEELLVARMARQEILQRDDPPVLWILLWEPVLQVPIGGKDVMRGQLAHLLKISESTDIAIRVVPTEAGGHPGLDGAFKIMTTEAGDVAFADSPGGGRLVLSAAEVRSYVLRYDRIGQQAMSEIPSRERITLAMEAMQ